MRLLYTLGHSTNLKPTETTVTVLMILVQRADGGSTDSSHRQFKVTAHHRIIVASGTWLLSFTDTYFLERPSPLRIAQDVILLTWYTGMLPTPQDTEASHELRRRASLRKRSLYRQHESPGSGHTRWRTSPSSVLQRPSGHGRVTCVGSLVREVSRRRIQRYASQTHRRLAATSRSELESRQQTRSRLRIRHTSETHTWM